MITFKLKSDGIFWVTVEGTLEMGEIRDYLSQFKNIKGLPDHLLLLYDLQNAVLMITAEDISEISRLGSESTISYKRVRTAFVVRESYLSAYSYLFAEKPDHPRIVRKVFGSSKAAVKWLTQSENETSPDSSVSAYQRPK